MFHVKHNLKGIINMIAEEKAENYIHDESSEDFEQQCKNIPNQNISECSTPKISKFMDILKTKTGDGNISDYEGHPLNFNNNKYIGQILRGLTGILGALDLAIIDIGMGILGLFKDRNIVKENIENV